MPSQAHLKGDGKSSHVPAPKVSSWSIIICFQPDD
jgi:hypothetical protein